MWPFSEMSLSAATALGNFANIGLILSLVTGAISTVLIYTTSDVKERHWGVARDQANERIANLSTLSEALRKDTAEANARAAEAQLELAKFKEPRQLTSEQQARISGKLIGFAGQQYLLSVATDQDALRLVHRLTTGTSLDNSGLARCIRRQLCRSSASRKNIFRGFRRLHVLTPHFMLGCPRLRACFRSRGNCDWRVSSAMDFMVFRANRSCISLPAICRIA